MVGGSKAPAQIENKVRGKADHFVVVGVSEAFARAEKKCEGDQFVVAGGSKALGQIVEVVQFVLAGGSEAFARIENKL